MANWMSAFRYALRALRRQPTFVLVALLTLTLGIGANTAIFSVIRAVVLNPLPYEGPEKIAVSSRWPPIAAWTSRLPTCAPPQSCSPCSRPTPVSAGPSWRKKPSLVALREQ